MTRRRLALGLSLALAFALAPWAPAVPLDPEARADRAFRRNLAAAPPGWHSARLYYCCSDCGFFARAAWAGGRGEYVFRYGYDTEYPAGRVSVWTADADRDRKGQAVFDYSFDSGGRLLKAEPGGGDTDAGWAEARAREFRAAFPLISSLDETVIGLREGEIDLTPFIPWLGFVAFLVVGGLMFYAAIWLPPSAGFRAADKEFVAHPAVGRFEKAVPIP